MQVPGRTGLPCLGSARSGQGWVAQVRITLAQAGEVATCVV